MEATALGGSWVLPRGHQEVSLRRRELTVRHRTLLALPTRRVTRAGCRCPGARSSVAQLRALDSVALRAFDLRPRGGWERCAAVVTQRPGVRGRKRPLSAIQSRDSGCQAWGSPRGRPAESPGRPVSPHPCPLSSVPFIPPQEATAGPKPEPGPSATSEPSRPGLARREEPESRWPDRAACSAGARTRRGSRAAEVRGRLPSLLPRPAASLPPTRSQNQ